MTDTDATLIPITAERGAYLNLMVAFAQAHSKLQDGCTASFFASPFALYLSWESGVKAWVLDHRQVTDEQPEECIEQALARGDEGWQFVAPHGTDSEAELARAMGTLEAFRVLFEPAPGEVPPPPRLQ